MNFKEEIVYREKILERVHHNIKPTLEERLWVQTHAIYNRRLGYPYYNTAI